jgi:FkbM family methyltransferase
MASLKAKAKVLARSRSLRFTNDYFGKGGPARVERYLWNGIPVAYRPGTSDTELIYSILLRRGKKSEYAMPPECRFHAGDVRTVLDIGANIGVSAVYLANAFPNASVHAFEPEPGNCELLRANAESCGRIKVHPFALGAEDGELTLFDSDNPDNFGGFSAHGAGVNRARSKSVPVRHAGRALAKLGIETVDVIKIDTEGAEWEILTALDRRLLAGARLILGELHGRRDFELLAYLQPMFDIGMKKQIRTRLFNFYAVNRER